MIKKIIYLFTFFISIQNILSKRYIENENQLLELGYVTSINLSNNCINFTVGSGTKCDWLCNYCATNLGEDDFYFPDNACTFEKGLCSGNLISGKSYKCCNYWKILYML